MRLERNDMIHCVPKFKNLRSVYHDKLRSAIGHPTESVLRHMEQKQAVYISVPVCMHRASAIRSHFADEHAPRRVTK